MLALARPWGIRVQGSPERVAIEIGADMSKGILNKETALNRPGFDGGLLSAKILGFVYPAEQSPQVAIV